MRGPFRAVYKADSGSRALRSMRLGIHAYKRTAAALTRLSRYQDCLTTGSRVRSMASGEQQQSASSTAEEPQQYEFGPYPISASEVFAKTQLSYAFVNLKPIVPGESSSKTST
eukprot:GHUV01037303.1.p1 GENE.GHUV01037303.1~~GHUV01037303.1.p1  ORF type:complete len:113 (+),score=9.24 GHUV01037303.1:141-479(+)